MNKYNTSIKNKNIHKPINHNLKILPKYFKAIVNGNKTFEVRKKDRDFKIGDQITLNEWKDGKYTGRSIKKKNNLYIR